MVLNVIFRAGVFNLKLTDIVVSIGVAQTQRFIERQAENNAYGGDAVERNLLCSAGGYIAYGVVADKRFTRDICYKPCLPGCSGGQGDLKINSQSQ